MAPPYSAEFLSKSDELMLAVAPAKERAPPTKDLQFAKEQFCTIVRPPANSCDSSRSGTGRFSEIAVCDCHVGINGRNCSSRIGFFGVIKKCFRVVLFQFCWEKNLDFA